MTIARNAGGERADEAGWPMVSSQNFPGATRRAGLRGSHQPGIPNDSGRLCEAIEKRTLQISDIDGATTERLQHAVLSGVSGSART